MKKTKIIRWNITNKCNIRCKHCYNFEYRNNIKEINISDKKTIINHLINENVLLKLSGGEPFMCDDFIELCRYISDKNINYGITTNGCFNLNNNKNIIKNSHLNFMTFSIDGYNDKHMCLRDYSRIDEIIYNITSVKRLNRSLKTAINLVLHKNNINDIYGILDFCFKKLNVDKVSLSNLQKCNIITDSYICNEYDYRCAITQIKRYILHNSWVANKIELAFQCNKIYEDIISDSLCLDYYCGAGRNFYFIDSNGNLLPCEKVLFTNFNSEVDCRYNLVVNNFLDIIDLPLYNYAYQRSLLFKNNLVEPKKELCKDCNYKERCMECPFL